MSAGRQALGVPGAAYARWTAPEPEVLEVNNTGVALKLLSVSAQQAFEYDMGPPANLTSTYNCYYTPLTDLIDHSRL